MRSGNPNRHTIAYRRRRFINWFLLGATYASFYMGRYNLNVIKPTIEKTFFAGSQTQFGWIGLCGFWTYALSMFVNGPLADRIGGKKAILLGALGAGLFNLLIGFLFLGGFTQSLLFWMCLLYSANMFFQSFGAMSVVKVNAPWFHVSERGTFGGIFGIMISCGYLLALQVSGWIVGNPQILSWYWAFLLPTVVIAFMFVLNLLFVKDLPSDAGYENFSTGDASDGDETPATYSYIFKQVFSNRVLLILMAAEFCTGFVRQSLLFFFPKWLGVVHHVAPGSADFFWASSGITAGGIVGGMIAGTVSDKFFDSRRPPVAFFFYLLQFGSILGLGFVEDPLISSLGIGFCCTWIFGVHGMLTGTASMDFGGRKGAASAAGMLDGIQYVASGITSVAMGWMIDHYGWKAWTYSILPFTLIGALIMLKIWNEKPKARVAY